MKKIIISFLLLFLVGGVKEISSAIVNLGVGIIDPTETTNGNNKGPVIVPNIDLTNGAITFKAEHCDYTLCIVNEDGNTVFSVFVPSTVTTVTLPSTLSGEYEILLYPDTGSIYFFGTITL
ncbi:MAG: hypothetical protein II826_08765 [Prevotella sp.]|nr:hypothetical protein [Prevotella sp.]